MRKQQITSDLAHLLDRCRSWYRQTRTVENTPTTAERSLGRHSIGSPVSSAIRSAVGHLSGSPVGSLRDRGRLLVSNLVLVLETHMILCRGAALVHRLTRYTGRQSKTLTLNDGIAVVDSKGTNICHGLDLGRSVERSPVSKCQCAEELYASLNTYTSLI